MWLVSLIFTLGVALFWVGVWIYFEKVHPQSSTENDCDNLVSLDKQLVGGEGIDRGLTQELPATNRDGSDSEARRTA